MFIQIFKSAFMRFTILVLLSMALPQCTKQLVNDKVNKEEAAKKHLDAAKVYIDKRNTRKALEHLQKSAQYNHKSAELFHTYALLYKVEGDAKHEELYYKKALGVDKNDSRTKNNYGSFLCFHNKASKGIRYLTEASEDYAYNGRAESFVNRGVCELTLKDEVSAEHSFQQSLRLNTDSIVPLIELADIYFKKNDFRLANLYYQQFLTKSGQQSAHSLWLGIQIARTQNDKNAESSYVLLLEKRFSNSEEYQNYLKSK